MINDKIIEENKEKVLLVGVYETGVYNEGGRGKRETEEEFYHSMDELSELAQTSVTLFALGSPSGTFTFNGTGGKPVQQSRNANFLSNFMSIRLYFGGSGLKLDSIKFELVERWN